MNSTAMVGIAAGLTTAILQSFSYLYSKRFTNSIRSGTPLLMVLAHIQMGIISLPLAIWLFPENFPGWRVIFLPVCATVGGYMAGQVALIEALKTNDPSRVSPLLTMKVALLSAAMSIFWHHAFTPHQWLGTACSLIAAFILSQAGKRMSGAGWLWLFLTCTGYATSDMGIQALIRPFHATSTGHTAAFCAALAYAVSGGIALLAWPFVKRNPADRPRDCWRMAAPFACTWFAAMISLIVCFALVGVVLGGIVQSSRGVISVGIAALAGHLGWIDVEPPAPRNLIHRRLLAALLMVIAVALFVTR
jgi:hypothetical protein